MSFSFAVDGNPSEVARELGRQAAVTPQLPRGFADALAEQLALLPQDAAVSLTCEGSTGWGEAQTRGEIKLNASISVLAASHPSAQTGD